MSKAEIGIDADGGEAVGSEERVVRRYLAPEDVFRAAYDRLVQALTLVAGNREVAADAVQEGFVRLIVDWKKVSTYDDPVAWVYRVALNRVRDDERSARRRTWLLLRLGRDAAAKSESAAGRASAADGAAASLSNAVVWEALRSLPRRQREAAALCYVAGLTRREAAEAMGISEGALSRHLHRAKQTLKEAMEQAP